MKARGELVASSAIARDRNAAKRQSASGKAGDCLFKHFLRMFFGSFGLAAEHPRDFADAFGGLEQCDSDTVGQRGYACWPHNEPTPGRRPAAGE